MTLECRNLFIDTQYFLNKSLDFESKELQSLAELVEKGSIWVFLTDINEREIRKKIQDHVSTAFGKINVSDARVLKAIPLFRKFLSTYNERKTVDFFITAFESFKSSCKVQVVSSNEIKPIDIFEDYCREQAPFNSTPGKNRKSEFPDAFALAAISNWANKYEQKAYLLSGDSDWQQFAAQSFNSWPFDEDEKRFFHLNDLSELLNLIIRNEESLLDLTKFSDDLLSLNVGKIEAYILEQFGDCDFIGFSDEFDIDVLDSYIISAKLNNKEIISVDRDGATYSIDFEVSVILKINVINYEASKYDEVDREYAYIEQEKVLQQHKFEHNLNLTFSFDNGIPGNFEIISADIPIHLELFYDEGEYVDLNEWVLNLPVIVCGVRDGKITSDGLGSETFENIEAAQNVYPALDIFKPSDKFTKALGNKISDDLRFETWKANDFYSS